MAPLGVLTAIVSAIRVGGPSWLKRLVGRARENTANTEIELMSSVSQEVCELWNGKSIVRSIDYPRIKQIIHLPAEKGDISPESFVTLDPETWSKDGKYRLEDRDSSVRVAESENFSKKSPVRLPEQSVEKATVIGVSKDANPSKEDNSGDIESLMSEKTALPTAYKNMPPNISLNIHGGSNPVELWVYAIFATILQISIFVWSGFITYSSYAQRHNLTGSKPSVGFWLQVIGAGLLTLSLIICVGIIDCGSIERHWSRTKESRIDMRAKQQFSEKESLNRRDMQLFWIQRQHTAGVNPYILCARQPSDQIHESYRANLDEERSQNDRNDGFNKRISRLSMLNNLIKLSRPHLTTYAVGSGVLGFVAQFQGLRFSNWTCSVAQLIALGVATFLRAWVRRGMNKTPVAVQVDNDYILDHLTLAIINAKLSDFEFPSREALQSPTFSLAFGVTSTPKLRATPKSISVSNYAQQALDLRVRLGRITGWTGPKSQEAIILSNSIETVLERLQIGLMAEYRKRCAVFLPVKTVSPLPSAQNSEDMELELPIIDDGYLKVDDAQLEALLSLVSYSSWGYRRDKLRYLKPSPQRSTSGWLHMKAPESQIYDIVVGRSSPKLLSDLFWWIPDMKGVLKEVEIVNMRKEDRFLTVSTGSFYGFEEKTSKVIKRSALGFYVDDNNVKGNGVAIIYALIR